MSDMDDLHGGIDQFGKHIPQAVRRDIESWRLHPELAPLYSSLNAHTDRHTFLNSYAEALVARHLLKHDCSLRFEVPTPTGRRADFEVVSKAHDVRFFLHVKRLNTQSPPRARLTVSSRLRVLERVKRPYIVSVRWREGLAARQMQHFVTLAEQFIAHHGSRIGDELTVRDEWTSQEIGWVRIIAPSDGSHVTLVIGMPSTGSGGFTDESPRMRKLLRKAYLQFMPKAPNVILMGTSHERDVAEFESALLGSHIERWDEHPPKGSRIAHGRAEDGFWSGRGFERSQVAAWFRFSMKDTSLTTKLWLRPGFESENHVQLSPLLRELFE